MWSYDHGVPRGDGSVRGKKITADERRQIIDLYRDGVPMRTIAGMLGRSYGAVNLVLHQQCEIEVSPRGGYQRRTDPSGTTS